MAWQDRLKTAAYTSPQGDRVVFDYEDVSRRVQKRATPFAFPNVNENYVQDNGFNSRNYPMRVFFWGDDHDIEATIFEQLLLTTGVGRLEHPLYGAFDVVPVGDITRRDDLVTAANQSVIEVTFWTTTREVYPNNQLDPRNEIQAQIDQFIAEGAVSQFDGTVVVDSASQQQDLKTRVEEALSGVDAAFSKISETTDEVNQRFQDGIAAINQSVDILVGEPLLLANQIADLVSLPARAVLGVADRLQGYALYIDQVILNPSNRPWEQLFSGLPRREIEVSNSFALADLQVASAVNGAALALVETEFKTRPEAINAAAALQSLFDQWLAFRDQGFEALEQIDPGFSYQPLQELVALGSGFITEISFTLLPERRVTLGRPRTIVDLSAELYGTTSNARLNELITNNDLSGSEIIELPRGRTVVYYAN